MKTRILLVSMLLALSGLAGEVEVITNVVYGKGGNEELKLDIVRPKENSGTPMPAVVFMHGGGWAIGDKSKGIWYLRDLAKRGYFGVTIDYRLTGKGHKFPAQIEDCKCAVRFLRAHAKEYNIDPDHIFAWGGSAGGHLAALLGTTDGLKEFEGTGGWENYSSKVQAVMVFCGVMDLYSLSKQNKADGILKKLIGGYTDEFKDAMNRASPISYITKNSAPFLLVHGDADEEVSFKQSQAFAEALKAAGVDVEFITIKDGKHGGKGWDATFNQAKVAGEFLDKYSNRPKSVTLEVAPTSTVSQAPITTTVSQAMDWREQVKTKKVVQPETEASVAWKFTPQPFPAIESVVAQKPDDVPLYGCYSWGDLQYRKDIKAVGWTTFRIGGYEDEASLCAYMEDGIEIMKCVQIGKTLAEIKTSGKRDAFASDEAYIQKFLQELDAFCLKYGPGGSLFVKRPDLAKNPIRSVEILNEPNEQYMLAKFEGEEHGAKLKEARDRLYAKVLKETYAFMKTKHPKIKVVGFSASGGAMDDVRFIGNVHALDPEIINSYDILATHPYTDVPPLADAVRKWGSYSVTKSWKLLRDITAKYGNPDKPIWWTEVGWNISYQDGGSYEKTWVTPMPPMLQAAAVTKLYVLASRLGVRRVFIFSISDVDRNNAGFFHPKTGEWRPSAYAVQQMISLLPKPRLLAAISEETGGLYAYQFTSDWTVKDSKDVIIAWQEQKRGALSVTIPAGRKVSKVLNMLGGDEPFTVKDGQVLFAGGPLPSYLVLE